MSYIQLYNQRYLKAKNEKPLVLLKELVKLKVSVFKNMDTFKGIEI